MLLYWSSVKKLLLAFEMKCFKLTFLNYKYSSLIFMGLKEFNSLLYLSTKVYHMPMYLCVCDG